MKKQIAGALAFLGWSFLASACGLISGVSDDYTYERADGAADAISLTDSTVVDSQPPPNDAQTVDAGREAGLCANAFPQPTGVSALCYACILNKCCSDAVKCSNPAQTPQCNEYLRCLGTCKQGPGAEGCRLGCSTARDGGTLSPLVTCQACKTPECAGQ